MSKHEWVKYRLRETLFVGDRLMVFMLRHSPFCVGWPRDGEDWKWIEGATEAMKNYAKRKFK